MNCSEIGRLRRLLRQEVRGGQAPSDGSPPALEPTRAGGAAAPSSEENASLSILLIMIFYGCLAGGLILARTRSRRLDPKHDPDDHLYSERDWAEARGSAHSQRPAGDPPRQPEG